VLIGGGGAVKGVRGHLLLFEEEWRYILLHTEGKWRVRTTSGTLCLTVNLTHYSFPRICTPSPDMLSTQTIHEVRRIITQVVLMLVSEAIHTCSLKDPIVLQLPVEGMAETELMAAGVEDMIVVVLGMIAEVVDIVVAALYKIATVAHMVATRPVMILVRTAVKGMIPGPQAATQKICGCF